MSKPLSLVPIGLLRFVVLAGPLAAQGEKITLRTVPAPNQVIRLGMTQNMSFDADAAAMPGGRMKIEGVTAFRLTQRVGVPDAGGRITAEFALDSMTIAMSMNGSVMPVPPMDSLQEMKFSIVYDSTGKVVDFKAAGQMETALNSVKTMMGQFANNLPNATLAVGDTVSMPVKMAIPIPALNPSGEPVNLEGRSVFKLVAVGHEGSDRIASLEVSMSATMSGNISLHMTGTGTMQLNVDKGFLKAGSNDLKMDMMTTLPGGSGTMSMNGTIHMVITGESRTP